MSRPGPLTEADSARGARPLLRVVRGEPTDEELAALLLVVTARASSTPTVDRPRSFWSDPADRMRRPPSPGAGAWRSCALPR